MQFYSTMWAASTFMHPSLPPANDVCWNRWFFFWNYCHCMFCTAVEICIPSGFIHETDESGTSEWLADVFVGGKRREDIDRVQCFSLCLFKDARPPLHSVVRAICKILTWLRMHWKAESPSVSAAELGCGWSVTTVDPLEEAARCVRAHRGNRWHHVSAPISVGAKQMVLCKFLNWIPILKLQLLTNPEPHSRQVIINICYPPPLLPRLSSCSINTGISSRTSSSLKLNIISTCIQHADECRTFIIS